MNSPFPGMDPYLEMHWGDVHARMIMYSSDQMQPQLPSDLFARVEERVFFERNGERESERYLTYIEIRDARSGNRVITVVEFLSPTNKTPGEGMKAYLKKQQECIDAGVSLVEIDLVRTGRPVFSRDPNAIPANIRTPYQAVVRRGWVDFKAEVYPLPVRKRLPAIRIPLRESDQDITLKLQALVDQSYVNGRYDTIDYQVDADPPLTGDDAQWADALLRAAGRRK